MIKLELKRQEFTSESTIGDLYIDGKLFCYTLEDAVRDNKIPGLTAIPEGAYSGIVNFSNRFKKNMPLVLDVPNFKGIRIHSGNTAKDTEGCILVGFAKVKNAISASRTAWDQLMQILKDEHFEITITNERATTNK